MFDDRKKQPVRLTGLDCTDSLNKFVGCEEKDHSI